MQKYLLKFSLCGLAYQLSLSDRQLISLSKSVGLGLFMDEIVSILGDHANSSREDQQAIAEHYLESQIPNFTKVLMASVLDDKVCLDVHDKLKLYGLTDLPSLVNDLDFAETFELFMSILSTFKNFNAGGSQPEATQADLLGSDLAIAAKSQEIAPPLAEQYKTMYRTK